MEDKKIKDLTEEEFDKFIRAIKWDRFNKWADGLTKDEDAQRDVDEVSKRTGLPKHSPLVMMATGFFAGVEAGVEIMQAFTEEIEKAPAMRQHCKGSH